MLFFLHFIKISWWCITILASLFMNLIVIVSISKTFFIDIMQPLL